MMSLAGGPWSTRRREDSGSMRKPTVSIVGSEGEWEFIGNSGFEGEVIEMRVTRLVSAVCRIARVCLMANKGAEGESPCGGVSGGGIVILG